MGYDPLWEYALKVSLHTFKCPDAIEREIKSVSSDCKNPLKKAACLKEILKTPHPAIYRKYEVPRWEFKVDYDAMEMHFIVHTTKKVRGKKIKTSEVHKVPLTHPLAKYHLLLAPNCETIEKFKDLKSTFGLELSEEEFFEGWMCNVAFYEIAEEITDKANFLGNFSTPLGAKVRSQLTWDDKAEAVLKYLKAYFRDSVPLIDDFPADAFQVYCPICHKFVEGSPYLRLSVFSNDDYAYWFAVLITHYRHQHISYYDKTLNNIWYGAKNKEFQALGEDYEAFKRLVNNRAKRQIIRAILKDGNLELQHKRKLIEAVFRLKDNDEKTIELAKKALNKLERGGKK